MAEHPLTKNQQCLFDAAENTNKCYLFHGKPGCGKSVLANALRTDGKKPWFFAAPTGLAATNIMGRTLHSLFRIPVSDGIIHPDYNRFPTDFKIIEMIRRINHLFIDEISMVRADTFDYLDRLMREAKGKHDLPFGGCQVIICGDFYQLPPVVRGAKEKLELREADFESQFVFSSKVFQGHFETLLLTEVLRQKGDPTFLNILDKARDGVGLLPKDLAPLNAQVGHPGDIRMRLCSKNKEAEAINAEELAKLPGEPITFLADSYGTWDQNPVELSITLKVGAQVLVKKNKADFPDCIPPRGSKSKVVNGTLGVVKAIDEKNATVDIELTNGEEVRIYRQRWERKMKEKVNGEWKEKLLAGFEQMPFQLAWAISIHKSQGQTFDSLHVDARSIFEAGQAYVAISRCRSLKGLSLEVPMTTKKFWADDAVIRFFEKIEALK